MRNTRVVDIYERLIERNISVDVYDPVADKEEAYQEYKIKLVDIPSKDLYDVILICVAHDQFKEMQINEIDIDYASWNRYYAKVKENKPKIISYLNNLH